MLFRIAWLLTLVWLHIIDIRIWKAAAPYAIVAIIGFVVGKWII